MPDEKPVPAQPAAPKAEALKPEHKDQPKPEPSHLPPAPKGPVLAPPPKARHPYYVAHTTFHLPDGTRFNRGDVLAGESALAYESALNEGVTDVNFATPTPHDTDPRA